MNRTDFPTSGASPDAMRRFGTHAGFTCPISVGPCGLSVDDDTGLSSLAFLTPFTHPKLQCSLLGRRDVGFCTVEVRTRTVIVVGRTGRGVEYVHAFGHFPDISGRSTLGQSSRNRSTGSLAR